MFTVLINFALSQVHSITSEEADKLFTEEPHKPIFVTLESMWCAHCLEFKPVKERIEQFYKDNDKVDIMMISCDNERDLCRQFQGEGTPRLYMVTTTIIDAERYEGSRSFEEIRAFIQKFIQPPVLQIENETQLSTELNANLESSIFFLQDFKNTNLSQIFSEIAKQYVNYPARFYNITYKYFQSDESRIYHYYTPTNKTLPYSGQINFDDVQAFIYEHLYPPFGSPSSTFFEIQTKLKEPFIVLEDWEKKFTKEIQQLTLKLPDNLKIIDIDCMSYERFCRAIRVDITHRPFISMVKMHKNTWYKFDSDYDPEKFVEWANKAWQGKLKEYGPGAGIMGFYRRVVKPFVQKNKLYFYLGIAFVVLIIIIQIIKACCFIIGFDGPEKYKYD
ncbi:Thioredoxin family protein [Trichomonas vaginalis G3]|uniref:Thioredoxin family protein n=1 Tax=Trichomonas vaginalis (strain ATCC PRA-98 / G3) TaxID=412133 RepID=A2DC27_TRIV3|nr:disulfide-isomerase C17h9.14C-related family [Trichomonas vaginalis G3]EAY22068.1 Thioredoxin family protein [Trichomonas vaginalis G3]KAI5525303.1 disulfide-isomerase C17h9.14C-related family [Trichomonas vaginalis G3]|eukprot:XP_001583054.1 Thioredoxin family protein [Trichomonas vaginalis G3]